MSILFFITVAILLRIFSNPAANVIQKRLTIKGYHPLAVNFITYLGLSILCLPFALQVAWGTLPSSFWIYAVLSGIMGAIGNGFLVKALQKGDLSVLGPINAYKSVVGILVALFLLGEVPNIWGIFGTILIIGGSYFVLDTTAEKFSWALMRKKEIQYRLWALVLTAIEAVFIKKVILASDVTISFITWCWLGAVFSFFLLPLYRVNLVGNIKPLIKANIVQLLMLVFCIGVMQLTTNYVFDHMPVGYALALFQLSTIVSVVMGYRFFNEQDIRKKLIGAAIMMLGSVFIILLKDH